MKSLQIIIFTVKFIELFSHYILLCLLKSKVFQLFEYTQVLLIITNTNRMMYLHKYYSMCIFNSYYIKANF
jgi:hypothetical protein